MKVWLNLINNSLAIFIERKITVPTITIKITDEKITFCDNGGGMNLRQNYNGLGLNMCRDITSKYGASFHLENSTEGCCTTILLVNVKTKA
jgi:signal transduction histidine kinase